MIRLREYDGATRRRSGHRLGRGLRRYGIPKAAQPPRLFERFYKVDRSRVRGTAGGTGLGLAIARHIVEQHGGRIWVESIVGHGTTLSFDLPIVGASDVPGPAWQAHRHTALRTRWTCCMSRP